MIITKLKDALREDQLTQIKQILECVAWERPQIAGQLQAIDQFRKDDHCLVLLAMHESQIVGYASLQYNAWNQLGQIHGLVVHPGERNKGYATGLIKEIEAFVKANLGRGVFVDTPVNNLLGCSFYEKMNYARAYVMPQYYAKGLDGVTFLKLFSS